MLPFLTVFIPSIQHPWLALCDYVISHHGNVNQFSQDCKFAICRICWCWSLAGHRRHTHTDGQTQQAELMATRYVSRGLYEKFKILIVSFLKFRKAKFLSSNLYSLFFRFYNNNFSEFKSKAKLFKKFLILKEASKETMVLAAIITIHYDLVNGLMASLSLRWD